jgi:hypothetical protein
MGFGRKVYRCAPSYHPPASSENGLKKGSECALPVDASAEGSAGSRALSPARFAQYASHQAAQNLPPDLGANGAGGLLRHGFHHALATLGAP